MKIKVSIGDVVLEYSENQEATKYLRVCSEDRYNGTVKGEQMIRLIKDLADKAAELHKGMYDE